MSRKEFESILEISLAQLEAGVDRLSLYGGVWPQIAFVSTKGSSVQVRSANKDVVLAPPSIFK